MKAERNERMLDEPEKHKIGRRECVKVARTKLVCGHERALVARAPRTSKGSSTLMRHRRKNRDVYALEFCHMA
jgi:hypothetical protein